MAGLIHRRFDTDYPRAVGGEGVYLIDAQGRRFLDASGGAAVSILGHSEERVVAAIRRQAGEVAFAHSAFFSSGPAETLAARLVERSGLERVLLLSGGSEAIEAAIKLSRQHWVDRGESQRDIFISRRQSYHGATLGALSLGGNLQRRAPYTPLLREPQLVSPCFEYRERAPGESASAFVDRLANELESTIERLGSDRVAGFFAETVGGATAGAIPPVGDYLARVREICDRHGVHLILDEVMCGMARTGTLFAYEQEGIQPDIVVIGKGLAAGYQPISAVLASQAMISPLEARGFFQHGHTFMAHPIAAAAACATLDVLDEDRLIDRVVPSGAALIDELRAAFGNHPYVGDIRGRGLLLAIEFVADRASKTPFPVEAQKFLELKRQAMARDLLCYAMGGTADGERGDHVLIAPPYILSPTERGELVARLAEAVDVTFGF